MIEGTRLQQPHRRAEHSRDLRIVPAGVGRAGLRIRHRMAHHHEGVELAEERQGGPVARAPGGIGPHAGEGQAGARGQSHPLEGLGDELRGLELLEPELGLPPDGLPERDDLLPAPVDRRLHLLREFALGHGFLPNARRSPPGCVP